LKNLFLRSSFAGGRSSGAFFRHKATKDLKEGEKFPPSRVGGGFFGIRKSTRMGCKSANGGLICAISITISSTQDTKTCGFVYSEWNECINGKQNRTVVCVCNDTKSNDFSECLKHGFTVSPLTRVCDDGGRPDLDCKWKWTRWSTCTRECGSGNTTRRQVCVCQGYGNEFYGAAPDEYCIDMVHYGVETCSCNDYPCGDTPAFNKGYWMKKDEDEHWPIADGTFNCSLGYDKNMTDDENPRGKKYSEVLREPEPQRFQRYEWYFIAKEWIACKLNIANGAKLSPEARQIIDEIGLLLEFCNGWPEMDIYAIRGGKEKLGRINNNIGGLANVDKEMAILSGGGNSMDDEYEGSNRSTVTLVLVIAIPLVAILILGVVIAITVYHVREKKAAVQDQAAFESEDDPSEGEPLHGTIVQDPLPQDVELESEKPIGDETSDGEDHH